MTRGSDRASLVSRQEHMDSGKVMYGTMDGHYCCRVSPTVCITQRELSPMSLAVEVTWEIWREPYDNITSQLDVDVVESETKPSTTNSDKGIAGETSLSTVSVNTTTPKSPVSKTPHQTSDNRSPPTLQAADNIVISRVCISGSRWTRLNRPWLSSSHVVDTAPFGG